MTKSTNKGTVKKPTEKGSHLLISLFLVLDLSNFLTAGEGGGPNECNPRLMRVINL